MSYHNLIKRNLRFFVNNLSDNTEENEVNNFMSTYDNNLHGGKCKKKKNTKKKFNVIDFDFDDLENADSEIFTNSKCVNPFIKKMDKNEASEIFKEDEDGKAINELEKNKLGIAISNKIGKAHIRNRLKRQTRAIIDEYRNLFKNNFNYIIMMRKTCKEAEFTDMNQALKSLLEK